MPPLAVGLGAAAIGIGGSILSAKSQSKAIDKASYAQAAASKEAVALQRDIYNKNVGFQTPYLNTGNAAMAQINALLGLQVPQGQQTGGTNALPEAPIPQQGNNQFFMQDQFRQMWDRRIANGEPLDSAPPWYRQQQAQQNPAPTAPVNTPAVTQPTAQSAYDQFKNYTGYQTRLTEANNAMNSAYAAKGSLQSGAALQAMAKMNQDYASGEFSNYMGYLGGQQQLGPQAANALSGVGTNYANSAGNIVMNQGNNLANAAIARGNNSSNMWNGIAGGLGGIAGMFSGSSYSDARLKTKIELIRREPDGLGIYEWNWKAAPDGERFTGVLAHEVKELRPQAYIPNYRGSGFDGVDYGKLAA